MTAHASQARPGSAYTKALVVYRAKLGAQLRAAREVRGFTLRALAEQVGLKAWSLLCAIENGRVQAPPDLARKLAVTLEAPELVRVLRLTREPIPKDVLIYLLEHPAAREALRKKVGDDP